MSRSINRVRRRACAAVLPVLVLAGTGAAQQFIGLGQLPGGTSSAALAISGDGGTAVGIARTDLNQRHAFRWNDETGMTDLGTLQGGTFTQALAVNGNGTVVVGLGDVADGSVHAIRWTAAQGLLDIGLLPDATFAEARGVNADGDVIVGLSGKPLGVGFFRAFRWTPQTGMQSLGVLGNDPASFATGVSEDGSVITGMSGDGSGATGQAFIWTAATGMHSIGTLTGGNVSNAHGLSGDGFVSVGVGDSAQGVRAFRWTAQGMTSLGIIPTSLQSTATCTSRDGSLVGGSCLVPGNNVVATIWTSSSGMVPLSSLLPAAALTDWRLTQVNGSSADGLHIAGSAVHDGLQEAWVATIPRRCASADFNCDGDVGTDADIESFFACLAGHCPASPCPSSADFDADGDVGTDADIESFFRVLAGGSCS